MFKKTCILIFSLVFLASCGDDTTVGTDATASSGLTEKIQADFSISIPSSWEEIENKEELLPKPKDGSIALAVSSKEAKGGFFNNLLILSDTVETFTTSKEFSMLSNVGASKDYIDYLELESNDITFIDSEISKLYKFEAKYNFDTPRLKFLQTAHVCKQNKVFLLTLALAPEVTDTSKYEAFMKTFQCK